jgi:hypothetical protein
MKFHDSISAVDHCGRPLDLLRHRFVTMAVKNASLSRGPTVRAIVGCKEWWGVLVQ